jgi:sodium-dependent dicarboxylate transporter 2/3/5
MAPNTQGNANRWRRAIAALASLVVIALSLGSSAEPRLARSALVAGLCLVLWLTEVVPPYVPTLVLWDVLMILGCVLISLTGPFVLSLVGIL